VRTRKHGAGFAGNLISSAEHTEIAEGAERSGLNPNPALTLTPGPNLHPTLDLSLGGRGIKSKMKITIKKRIMSKRKRRIRTVYLWRAEGGSILWMAVDLYVGVEVFAGLIDEDEADHGAAVEIHATLRQSSAAAYRSL
jgi:hypothetical protein